MDEIKKQLIDSLSALVPKDDPMSCYKKGYAYYEGKGVEQDDVKAQEWFLRAVQIYLYRVYVDYLHVLTENLEEGRSEAFGDIVKLGEILSDRERTNKEKAKEFLEYVISGEYKDAIHLDELIVSFNTLKAVEGSADEQFKLALMFQDGDMVEQSDSMEFFWTKRAAENGHVAAQDNLGVMYFDGKVVEQNLEEAVRWFKKSAEKENAVAQYNLSIVYHHGWGIEKSQEEAVVWAIKSADQGYDKAQYILGVYCVDGECEDISKEEAIQWIRKAAEQGHEEAQNLLALSKIHEDNSSSEEKVRLLKQSSERGFVAAQISLGLMYVRGSGVERDYKEACDLFSRAATFGDSAVARYLLGLCILYGWGAPEDSIRSMRLFRLSAEQGYHEAQMMIWIQMMDSIIDRGDDFDFYSDKDVKKSMTFLVRAALGGNAEAIDILGDFIDSDGNIDTSSVVSPQEGWELVVDNIVNEHKKLNDRFSKKEIEDLAVDYFERVAADRQKLGIGTPSRGTISKRLLDCYPEIESNNRGRPRDEKRFLFFKDKIYLRKGKITNYKEWQRLFGAHPERPESMRIPDPKTIKKWIAEIEKEQSEELTSSDSVRHDKLDYKKSGYVRKDEE